MRAHAIIVSATLALIAVPASPAGASPAERWWSYLASYDDGPGSIRLDLNLYRHAPFAEYTRLVITGAAYATGQPGGLPEPGDLERLNALSSKALAAIKAVTPAIYAGSFTHGGEQLNYVYVKNPARVEKALAAFYAKACGSCKVHTHMRDDASWSAYRTFLFPNLQTREFYRDELKAIGFAMPLTP